MKLRSLAQVAAGMMFLAAGAFAQITTIEGDVKGADGKPVEKAVVKITRTDIKGNYETKTNKKGHYLYMGLPMGTYSLEVVIEGKKVDAVNGIKTRPGDPIPVNFDLKASQAESASKQAEMQKAMETGQLSKEMERSMTKEQKEAMEKNMKDREAQMKKRNELNSSFNDGMTAMTNKQYDVAVTNFTKAAEVDPTQTAVWAQLGEAYVKLAETKTGEEFNTTIGKGLEAYAKAIELKPDDPASHNNYALALSKAKKFPEMQAELKKAADLDPPNAGKYYYNLGAVLVNTGQNDAAGEAFKKAIELTPTYADAYYQYGVTLVGKAAIDKDGKVVPPAGTKEAFQKYLELAPTGQWAQSAKEMMSTMDMKVDTNFTDPNAKKNTKSTTKKK
jgi:tetratricopeptide (TPR) repeat protein